MEDGEIQAVPVENAPAVLVEAIQEAQVEDAPAVFAILRDNEVALDEDVTIKVEPVDDAPAVQVEAILRDNEVAQDEDVTIKVEPVDDVPILVPHIVFEQPPPPPIIHYIGSNDHIGDEQLFPIIKYVNRI